MSESTSGQITVRCSCGAKLKVGSASLGKKARCPKCKEIFTITAPSESAATDLGPTDLLSQLAQTEASAAPVASTPQTPRYIQCPGCRSMMASAAAVCISCGYNRETGRVMKAAAPRAERSEGLASRLAKFGGPWGLGCLFGGLAVLLGSAVWVTIAVITGFEIGWIAWGVGALAGYGMSLGYKESNPIAGAIAAGMAALGIVVAKAVVFMFVLYTVVTGDTSDISAIRTHVKLAITEEILDEQGVYSSAERGQQRAAAFRSAHHQVTRMSDEQVKQRRDEIREEAQRRFAAMDPTGSKVVRLSKHRADRRADLAGLTFGDESRKGLYREEFAKCKNLSSEELAAATAELDLWEKEGRWSDASYVRSQLVHNAAREIIQKTPEYAPGGGDRSTTDYQWRRLYNQAAETVDALSPQQQVERLKTEENADFVEEQRARLAYHLAELESMRLGLSYDDPKRDEIYEAQDKVAEEMTPADLEAAAKKLDAWEESGRDNDTEYVRNQLIYREIDLAQEEERSSDSQQRASVLVQSPSPEEWKALYDDAVAKVDPLSPAERLERLSDLDARQAQSWKDKSREAETAEVKEASSALFGMFFSTLYHPMSLLFFILAVVSAFRLGSAGR